MYILSFTNFCATKIDKIPYYKAVVPLFFMFKIGLSNKKTNH